VGINQRLTALNFTDQLASDEYVGPKQAEQGAVLIEDFYTSLLFRLYALIAQTMC
jgi:hypothetical protein